MEAFGVNYQSIISPQIGQRKRNRLPGRDLDLARRQRRPVSSGVRSTAAGGILADVLRLVVILRSPAIAVIRIPRILFLRDSEWLTHFLPQLPRQRHRLLLRRLDRQGAGFVAVLT